MKVITEKERHIHTRKVIHKRKSYLFHSNNILPNEQLEFRRIYE